MLSALYKGSPSSYEDIVNGGSFPAYHDVSMNLLIVMKFIIYTILVFTILFIQVRLLYSCIEQLNKSDKNLLNSLVQIKINSVGESKKIDYKFCLVLLCFAFIAWLFVLYIDIDVFATKRDVYLAYVKKLVDQSLSTDFVDYNVFAEKFLNHYFEHIALGFHKLIDQQIWFWASVCGVLSVMVSIHVLYYNNSTNLIKIKEDIKRNDWIWILRSYAPSCLMYSFALGFFFMYHQKIINFLREQKRKIKNKVTNHLSNHNSLSIKLSSLFEQEDIDNFTISVVQFKKFAIVMFLGLAVVASLIHQSNPSGGVVEGTVNVDLAEVIKYIVMIVFLYFNNTLFYNICGVEKSVAKILRTMAAIECLNQVPRVATNQQKTCKVEMFQVEMQLRQKHYSGVNSISPNIIKFTIKKNDKVIITCSEIDPNCQVFSLNLVNTYKNQMNEIILVDEKGERITINNISEENWKRLIYIDCKISLYENKTIYENFTQFVPGLTKQQVNDYLKLALLTDVYADTICVKFPRNIFYRILIAIAMSMEQNKDLIIIDHKLLSIFSLAELIEIVKNITKLNTSIILEIQRKVFTQLPKYLWDRFSIYNLQDDQLQPIKDFSNL